MPDADVPLVNDGTEYVIAKSLKLAAWLRLKGEKLVGRSLQPNGRIAYHFVHSETIHRRARQWISQRAQERDLARYATFVSYEIRTAVKIRRAARMAENRCPEPTIPVSQSDFEKLSKQVHPES